MSSCLVLWFTLSPCFVLSSLPPALDLIASSLSLLIASSRSHTQESSANCLVLLHQSHPFHLVHQHLANNNRYHYNHLGFVCTIRPPGRDARSPETGVCFTYVHLMRALFLPSSLPLSSSTSTSNLPSSLFSLIYLLCSFHPGSRTISLPSHTISRIPILPLHSFPFLISLESSFLGRHSRSRWFLEPLP